MKKHTNTTFYALIEAIQRHQADTFIEQVNNCDDLFGHDAEGHSLMWYAQKSSDPVFAETLNRLAKGRPFTETGDAAPSDDKKKCGQEDGEEHRAISFAKLGWAAAIVLLTAAVIGYFWHLYHRVAIHPYLTVHTLDSWLSGIGFSISATAEACVALWILFKAGNRRHYVVLSFLPVLAVAFAAAAGSFYSTDCNKTEIISIYGGLVALACLHLIYNYFRNSYCIDNRECRSPLAPILVFTLGTFGMSYFMLYWRDFGLALMPIVACSFCVALPLLTLEFIDDEFSEHRLLFTFSMKSTMLLFLSAIILDLWYATAYTIAEFATYHNMPAIVETILPDSCLGSRIQHRHIYNKNQTLKQWCKEAMEYAATHGDVRSVKVYHHQVMWGWDDALKLDDTALAQQMKYDDPEMLEHFIDHNADACLNAIMKQNARKNTVFLIQKNGCNATYGDSGKRRTLLQAAVECNNVNMVELLLKHGADPDFAESGKTPRRMAEEKKWGYALKLFNDYGYKAS